MSGTAFSACITAFQVGSEIVCIMCNYSREAIAFNNVCQCSKEGFELIDGHCADICGDGKLFTLACDDNNTVEGDGCSGQCEVELMHSCENGTDQSASQCFYLGSV